MPFVGSRSGPEPAHARREAAKQFIADGSGMACYFIRRQSRRIAAQNDLEFSRGLYGNGIPPIERESETIKAGSEIRGGGGNVDSYA